MSTKKCECVELYEAPDYRNSRRDWGQGGLLLHEFCHAYHHKGCTDGYDNEDIIQCYESAMEEGIYDSVPVHGPQGPHAEAYAKTNAMEYFAELSTAFLGGIPHPKVNDDDDSKNDTSIMTNDSTKTKSRRHPKQLRHPSSTATHLQTNHNNDTNDYNKWYPHSRQQIQDHDPRAYALLQKMWKIRVDQ